MNRMERGLIGFALFQAVLQSVAYFYLLAGS